MVKQLINEPPKDGDSASNGSHWKVWPWKGTVSSTLMAWLVFVLMTLTLPLHPLLSHVWCISLVNQSRTDRLSIIEGYYWSGLSSNSLTSGLRRRRLCLPLWILPSSLERWSTGLFDISMQITLILLRKQKENKLDVFCDGKWKLLLDGLMGSNFGWAVGRLWARHVWPKKWVNFNLKLLKGGRSHRKWMSRSVGVITNGGLLLDGVTASSALNASQSRASEFFFGPNLFHPAFLFSRKRK